MMYETNIVALVYISESEIAEIYKDYQSSWETEQPEKFKDILFQFGLDVNIPYIKQEDILHRNLMNRIVKCHRWVGNSRIDEDWLLSGLASREAIDKSKGNKLLVDLYRSKGLTTDRNGGVWEDEDSVLRQPGEDEDETSLEQENEEGIENAIARN